MRSHRFVRFAILAFFALPGLVLGQIPVDAKLQSQQEVPPILSLAGGNFAGELSEDLSTFDWELTYSGIGSGITQAHIHFAQAGVNGGIMLFLCTNLGNGPVGTHACPASGTISGSASAVDITGGAVSQGVTAGHFFGFQRAVRQGVAYVNLHSVSYPGGELRGQLRITPLPQP